MIGKLVLNDFSSIEDFVNVLVSFSLFHHVLLDFLSFCNIRVKFDKINQLNTVDVPLKWTKQN